ncbi:MAG: hypothetical protein HYS52_00170 [Candidatus Wildermuthbacteria bacterium]|nr:hypothetical protein [Candidatus Wildermuthbacteria bacterium]
MSDPELLEFLKRHEVRTMAKDIAKLRDQEAQKEKEKILKLQAVPKAPETAPAKEVPAPRVAATPSMVLPGKPSRFSKVLIRIFFVVLILFIVSNAAAFAYWLFKKRGAQAPPSPPSQQQPREETSRPRGFFEGVPQTTLFLQEREQLFSGLEEILKQDFPAGLTRLTIQTMDAESSVDPRVFFQTLVVKPPENFVSLLEEPFAVFVFTDAEKTRKRVGFVVQLQEPKRAEEILGAWEPDMEKSFALLSSLHGPKDNVYTNLFGTALFQDIPIRFQQFSLRDSGLFYAVAETNFIFSGSLDGMKEALGQIKK